MRGVAPCDFPPKNLYFPLPQESMRTTFHYPESPYGRTYADVITKISRMDSLPNYLSYGGPLARASRAQGAPLLACSRRLDSGEQVKSYAASPKRNTRGDWGGTEKTVPFPALFFPRQWNRLSDYVGSLHFNSACASFRRLKGKDKRQFSCFFSKNELNKLPFFSNRPIAGFACAPPHLPKRCMLGSQWRI